MNLPSKSHALGKQGYVTLIINPSSDEFDRLQCLAGQLDDIGVDTVNNSQFVLLEQECRPTPCCDGSRPSEMMKSLLIIITASYSSQDAKMEPPGCPFTER